MAARVVTVAFEGVEARRVDVEVQLTTGQHAFVVVGLADKAVASLRDGKWLTPDALVVVEESKAAGFSAPDGFEELDRRAYDETEFVFLRAN